MLNNKGNNLPHQPDNSSRAENRQDPWQSSSPEQKTNTVPKNWTLFPENLPLISPTVSPFAPKLASHEASSAEILLEDELKLKTTAGSFLSQQLEKAFTLLYWVQTIGQSHSNWQIGAS